MQEMEIWLVILFLSSKEFNAKQIFVLSSSMKLGSGWYMLLLKFLTVFASALDQNIPSVWPWSVLSD